MVKWEKGAVDVVGCEGRVILSFPRHAVKMQILLRVRDQVEVSDLTSFRETGRATAEIENSWSKRYVSICGLGKTPLLSYLSARTLGSEILSQEYVP